MVTRVIDHVVSEIVLRHGEHGSREGRAFQLANARKISGKKISLELDPLYGRLTSSYDVVKAVLELKNVTELVCTYRCHRNLRTFPTPH